MTIPAKHKPRKPRTPNMPTVVRPVRDGTEAVSEFDFDGTIARTIRGCNGYAITPDKGVISFWGKTPIYLKPGRADGIYCFVNIYRSGKAHSELLHRLVALAYLPNPSGKPQVHHKDGNPQNNALSNLEWVTAQENSDYKKALGRKPRRMTAELQAKAIALFEGGMDIPTIALTLDVNYRATARVVRGAVQPARKPPVIELAVHAIAA